jgi:Glycosyltransferase WbsX
MARDAGIAGFCYYHYWFGNGRRILERPFDEVLASGRPDFPFCLAWANQSWSGIWHGEPKRTLIEQVYPGVDDFKAHFELVLPAFRDRRYMTIDGKPIFVVFDPRDLGDTASFVNEWRKLADKAGLPGIHFVGMTNKHAPDWLAPFDMLTEYGPQNYLDRLPSDAYHRALRRLKRGDLGPVLNRLLGRWINRPQRCSYRDMIEKLMKLEPADSRYVPCVMPNWDNTPRSRLRGVVFEGATPELFETYLHRAVAQVARRAPEERIVFLKAWNEWAEGNYVEPDARFGHRYLDVIRKVVLE